MSPKDKSILQIRSKEREDSSDLRRTDVYLYNPSSTPVIDRGTKDSGDGKAVSMGFDPSAPRSLLDLVKGDAGSGRTFFRRIHSFFSMAMAGDSGYVSASNFVKAIPIATGSTKNQKPKYWHVSAYGTGVRRPAAAAPLLPLSESEVDSLKFEGYYTESAPGVFVPLGPRFVPSVTTSQVRVMIHDESGQRFFDADVIGSRSFSVYAWAVTVFLLVKDDGYEVDFMNESSIVPLSGNGVGVEDDVVGARVVPVTTNITENVQNRTLSITINPSRFGILGPPRIVPIPPGAKSVQVFSTDPAPALRWQLDFYFGRSISTTRPDVGRIDFIPGQSTTDVMNVVNSSSIAITPTDPEGTPPTSFSLVFEVEP